MAQKREVRARLLGTNLWVRWNPENGKARWAYRVENSVGGKIRIRWTSTRGAPKWSKRVWLGWGDPPEEHRLAVLDMGTVESLEEVRAFCRAIEAERLTVRLTEKQKALLEGQETEQEA